MKTFTAAFALLLVCGCAHVETGPATGAKAVVQRLFVDRLSQPKTFDFFTFWNLPQVEGSFDAPMRQAFDDFKATCKRVYPRWGKWGKGSEVISATFSIYANNDPLTMVTVAPANPRVVKVKEDATSATYKVTYTQGVDGAIGQYYKIVSTVTLVNKDGQWLVSAVSNEMGGKTYTFPGRLQELIEKLKAGG